MNKADSCLRHIMKIREVASGEVLPYVGRSRIGRLVWGLNALTSEAAHEVRQDLLLINSRIQNVAKSICQPSEPLDSRWRDGWSDLLLELDSLETLLRDASSGSMNA